MPSLLQAIAPRLETLKRNLPALGCLLLSLIFIRAALQPTNSRLYIAVAGLFLASGWLYFCARAPFQSLCVVMIFGMTNGIFKQVFNWSQIVYAALDVPWVLFLVVFAIRQVAEKKHSQRTLLDTLFLLFLLWSAVQVLNPNLESRYMAIGALRNRLLPMLFYWVGKNILDEERTRKLLLLCIAVAGVGAAFGIYEWYIGESGVLRWGPGFKPRTTLAWRDEEGHSNLRPLSLYQDAGIAAIFSAIIFCIVANINDFRLRYSKQIIIGSGLACLCFAAVSGVRASVLCIGAGLCVSLLLSWKRMLPVVITLLCAATVLLLLGGAKLSSRYETILNPLEAYSSNRGYTVTGFFTQLAEYPLGFGMGSATSSADVYANLFDEHVNASLPADNGFSNLLSEGGLPYIFLYLGIIGTAIYEARAAMREDAANRQAAAILIVFSAILIVWSVTALPIDWQPTNLLYWLLLGSFANLRAQQKMAALTSLPALDVGSADVHAVDAV